MKKIFYIKIENFFGKKKFLCLEIKKNNIKFLELANNRSKFWQNGIKTITFRFF